MDEDFDSEDIFVLTIGIAVQLCAWIGIVLFSTSFFQNGYATSSFSVWILSFSLLIAWIGFILSFPLCQKNSKKVLILIIGVGLLIRLLLCFSQPIQEDDFFRYIWDGQVVLSGQNPYTYSPEQLDLEHLERPYDVETIKIKSQINYPFIKTIYPPVAELFFAVSQWVSPWKIWGLRFGFLLFDLGCLALILVFLKRWGYPLGLSLIYFWNPLIIHQTFNTLHYDIVCAFFILLFFYCLQSDKIWGAGLACLVAVLTKITPIILVPIFSVYLYKKGRVKTMLLYWFIFIGALGLIFAPGMWGYGIFSGLTTFSTQWQMNSSVFIVLRSVFQFCLPSLSLIVQGLIVKGILGLVFCILAFKWMIPMRSLEDVIDVFLKLFVMLFLFSPCGNPWYLVWFMPLLCFIKFPSLGKEGWQTKSDGVVLFWFVIILGIGLSFYDVALYYLSHDLMYYLVTAVEYVPLVIFGLYVFWVGKQPPRPLGTPPL